MYEKNQASTLLKPLPLWQASILFGVPALLFVFATYVVQPYLVTRGNSEFVSYLWAYLGGHITLFVAALMAYRLEGNPLSWSAFLNRFRLNTFGKRAWLWIIAVFVSGYTLYVFLITLTNLALGSGLLVIPHWVPLVIDPRLPQTAQSIHLLFGDNARGDWTILFLYLTVHFFNITGEEFWWRGYILPRQELTHGKWTWVIHGTLWAIFHITQWWTIIALLPSILLLSLMAQRLRSTWPGIVVHSLMNLLVQLVLVVGVIVGAI